MRAFTLLLAVSCILPMQAQELLSNGGFEQYTSCPDSASQINHATGWWMPTAGSSDYFNACFDGPPSFDAFNGGVPDNNFGHQPAHSGNAYAGFFCFVTDITGVPGDNYHEYVSHALDAPLIPGEVYTVEFFVSLADRSVYAMNDVGALLSVQPPHSETTYPLAAHVQVLHPALTLLDDSIGWTRISGCFTADSAYAYITIGSFHLAKSGTQEGQAPTAFPPAIFYSYYYVDDVSVQHLTRPDLGPDLTMCATTSIAVQDPLPDADYLWSTGTTGPSITADVGGTYSVELVTDGCPLVDSITLTDTCEAPVYAPNAFTPNGDGINDLWRPVWKTSMNATLEWTVLDRWGHVLFSATDLDDAWDGTAGGSPVPNGSYVWRGHAHDPDTALMRELHGEVVLVR